MVLIIRKLGLAILVLILPFFLPLVAFCDPPKLLAKGVAKWGKGALNSDSGGILKSSG
jgi:hypothetical protein